MKSGNQILLNILVNAVIDNVLPILLDKTIRDLNTPLLKECIQILSEELLSTKLYLSPKLNLCWSIFNYFCPDIDEKECTKNFKWVDDVAIKQGILKFQLCSLYKYLKQQTPPSAEIER